jgi:pyruvate dehydrogenase kinase 2/3/4
LALRQPPVENYIGMICLKTSPYHAVQQAIDDATLMCTRGYGDSSDWDMDSIRSEKMNVAD